MEEIRSFWGGGGGGRSGGGVKRKKEKKRKREKKGLSKYCVSVSVSLAPAEPLMWFTGWIKEGKSIPIVLQLDRLSKCPFAHLSFSLPLRLTA